MDQPDTTRDNTAADMAAPQASGGDEDQPADMAVEVEGMAQVAAALRAAQPDPAAIAAAAPSAAAFGHSGAAEATAAFFARYAQLADTLTADHAALVDQLADTAASYHTTETTAAHQLGPDQLGAAQLAGPGMPRPRTPEE